MQNYSYIALNSDSQQLKGIISAEDSRGARKKLHDMGLSVIILEETNETRSSSAQNSMTGDGMQSFEFHVVDSNGKSLNGTIDAIDRKNALRRLATEYNFKILSLANTKIPLETRFEEGKKDLQDLIEETEIEFGITINKEEQGAEDSQLKDLVGDGFEEERQILMAEIDTITQKTTQILIEYQEKIPPESIDDTRKYLDELMRLKLSNNLVLIRKLTESLFKKVDELIEEFISNETDDERLKELKEALAEEQEDMEKARSSRGNNYQAITTNLKALSERLDHLLGKKSLRKKKKEEMSEIRILFKEFSRVSKMFFSAIFTTNQTLRKQRLNEVQKTWNEWLKKWNELNTRPTEAEKTEKSQRKTLQQIRAQKFQQTSEIHEENPSEELSENAISEDDEDVLYIPETDIVSIFLRELRFFIGSLLAVLLFFFFFSDFFLLYSEQSISKNFEKVSASPGFFLFFVFLFYTFFFLTIRERYFWGKIMHSAVFFLVCCGGMFWYASNY